MKPLILVTNFLFFFVCAECKTNSKEAKIKYDKIHNEKASITKTKHISTLKTKHLLNLPFVGTRYFNFDGGSGTGSTLKITKDGIVTIKGVPDPGAERMGAVGEIEFSGKFKPIIKTKYGDRYKIEANKISKVDANGTTLQGCGSIGNEPCNTSYYIVK